MDDNYKIMKPHRFFSVTAAIVEQEINMGVTVTFSSEVDLTGIDQIREALPKDQRPSYNAFVIKTLAVALKEFPYANRRIIRRGILPFAATKLQQFTSSDIAVAVERDLEGIEVGVFIDILRNAEELTLDQITDWLRELSKANLQNNQQWRLFYTGISKLPGWLAKFIAIYLPVRIPSFWSKWRGGAVLLSTPARFGGVGSVSGAWTHPLGVTFGMAQPKPLVRHGQIEIAKQFTFSMNFDRRVMAGAQSARFFQRLVTILENPTTELAPWLPALYQNKR